MGPLFYAYERIEMSKSETYVKRTEEFLEKLSSELQFEVVDVEFVKEAGEYYLRAYCDMDKEGGIGIDDCVEISRHLATGWMKRTLLKRDIFWRFLHRDLEEP